MFRLVNVLTSINVQSWVQIQVSPCVIVGHTILVLITIQSLSHKSYCKRLQSAFMHAAKKCKQCIHYMKLTLCMTQMKINVPFISYKSSVSRVFLQSSSLSLIMKSLWCTMATWLALQPALIHNHSTALKQQPTCSHQAFVEVLLFYIPPSIVLPIQQVGFNCDNFPPEGYKENQVPSPCIFQFTVYYIVRLQYRFYIQ